MGQKVDVVAMQEVLGNTRRVGAGVVLLEQEVWVPLEKRHHMGLEDLRHVAVSVDTISTTLTHILEDNRAYSLVQANGAPYHDASTSPSVVMQDVGLSKPFAASSPDLHAAIHVINAETLLVREEDPPPVPKTPVDVLPGPRQTLTAVVRC